MFGIIRAPRDSDELHCIANKRQSKEKFAARLENATGIIKQVYR